MLWKFSKGYIMGCPSVRRDNPRALASGLSYVQVDKHGITIIKFIPPTSVLTLHTTWYFVIKLVKVEKLIYSEHQMQRKLKYYIWKVVIENTFKRRRTLINGPKNMRFSFQSVGLKSSEYSQDLP